MDGIQKGIQKGIQEGIEEGIQEGLQKGIREGKLQIARTMLDDGMPLERVVRYSGLSEQEIRMLDLDG